MATITEPPQNRTAIRSQVSSTPVTEAERSLHDFCTAVLELLTGAHADASVLSQVLPSLAQTVAACGEPAISRLQTDLQNWQVSARQLSDFAVRYCGGDAVQLLAKLEQTRADANLVIQSIHSLCELHPAPVDSEENPDCPHYSGGRPSLPSHASLMEIEQATVLFQRGEQAFEQEDFELAARFYSQALHHDSGMRLAWAHRGRTRLMQGNTERAIEDFNTALALNPHDALAYGWRGDAHTLAGDFSDAVADYTRALELSPDLIVMRYNRGVALRQSGELDRALAEFDDLVRIKPDHGPFYVNRGLIWLAWDDRARAVREFHLALQFQPQSVEARHWLDVIEGHHGRLQPPSSPSRPPSRIKTDKKRRGKKRRNAPETRVKRIATEPEQHREQQAPSAVETVADIPSRRPAPATEPRVEAATEQLPRTPLLVSRDQPTVPEDFAAPFPTSPRISMTSADTVMPLEVSIDSLEPSEPIVDSVADALANINQYQFQCPSCRAQSSIPWSRMQSGKVLACPGCRKNFVARANGKLVRVARDRHGQWKERVALTSPATWKRLTVGTGGLALVALIALATSPFWRTPKEEFALPKELTPRAEMFGAAWVTGDYGGMRQFISNDRRQQLSEWYRKHPSPEISATGSVTENELDVKVAVKLMPATSQTTQQIVLHFKGVKLANGDPVDELRLSWEKESRGWTFQPHLSQMESQSPEQAKN